MRIENDALWKGFANYVKFKPNANRDDDYGQPSTWILLTKDHANFQSKWGSHSRGKAPWYAKFTWQNRDQKATLDTTIGGPRNHFLFEGITALSRGMAYYHRPDNWTEHPNFFNPFWRARLAPVDQRLQRLWDQNITKDIEGGQFAVSLLRNAQMDMFTEFVTSLITH